MFLSHIFQGESISYGAITNKNFYIQLEIYIVEIDQFTCLNILYETENIDVSGRNALKLNSVC